MKKQLPLRISEELFDDLSEWANQDFRSINAQIEYLLTECVKQRKKNSAQIPAWLKQSADESVKERVKENARESEVEK